MLILTVVVCASPPIERTVRTALHKMENMGHTGSWGIKLYTSIFRVEEKDYH